MLGELYSWDQGLESIRLRSPDLAHTLCVRRWSSLLLIFLGLPARVL